jgi:hypothetical protein
MPIFDSALLNGLHIDNLQGFWNSIPRDWGEQFKYGSISAVK